jgi:hypothetical protein
MAKIKVFYDYHEGEQVPIWYVIRFNASELDYNKTLYIPIEAPFEATSLDGFDESIMAVSIFISDLTLNPNKINRFGIHLPAIHQRLELSGVDTLDIEQFVLQVSDIEEILQMKVIHFD